VHDADRKVADGLAEEEVLVRVAAHVAHQHAQPSPYPAHVTTTLTAAATATLAATATTTLAATATTTLATTAAISTSGPATTTLTLRAASVTAAPVSAASISVASVASAPVSAASIYAASISAASLAAAASAATSTTDPALATMSGPGQRHERLDERAVLLWIVDQIRAQHQPARARPLGSRAPGGRGRRGRGGGVAPRQRRHGRVVGAELCVGPRVEAEEGQCLVEVRQQHARPKRRRSQPAGADP